MEPILVALCVCGAVIVLPILGFLSRLLGMGSGKASARPRAWGDGGGARGGIGGVGDGDRGGGGTARPRYDDPDVVSGGGIGRAPRQQPRGGVGDVGSNRDSRDSRDSRDEGLGGAFDSLRPGRRRSDDEVAGEIVLGSDEDQDRPAPRTTRPRPDSSDDQRRAGRGGKIDDDDIESRGGFGRSK
jgi:hypothetical protein